jgi:hypothetical protein
MVYMGLHQTWRVDTIIVNHRGTEANTFFCCFDLYYSERRSGLSRSCKTDNLCVLCG